MKLKATLVAVAASAGLLFAGQTASAAENNSIVDYLYNRGEDYSFSHRANLAANHGIQGYKGSAYQNIALLGKLQGAPVSTPVQAQVQPEPKQETEVQSEPASTPSQSSGKKMTVTATAYTAFCSGCSGVTATGINLRSNPSQKVIAVDPRVIPLGSKVYVEGYGTAIAGDTGGSIKGQRIDLFMASNSDAMAFGRKTVEVTVLN